MKLCEYESQTLEAFLAARSRFYAKFDCPLAARIVFFCFYLLRMTDCQTGLYNFQSSGATHFRYTANDEASHVGLVGLERYWSQISHKKKKKKEEEENWDNAFLI